MKTEKYCCLETDGDRAKRRKQEEQRSLATVGVMTAAVAFVLYHVVLHRYVMPFVFPYLISLFFFNLACMVPLLARLLACTRVLATMLVGWARACARAFVLRGVP